MYSAKPAACTFPFAKQPLDYTLKHIATAGFEEVDLLGRLPHFSVNEAEYSLADLERLLRENGLRVVNIGGYFGMGLRKDSSEEEMRSELAQGKRAIEIAVRLGARSIRVHPGDRTHETAFALVPFFRELAAAAEEKGIYLGVETHGGITCDAKGMVEFCREVGSRHFGVLYDPCNVLAHGIDYREAYHTFHDHIVFVHLKDGFFKDGKFERVMLGDGAVDIPWLLGALEKDGYSGDIALEYEVNHLEPPETGLRRWRERYREITGR
ncbi:MAG TPA: sugar phosphate isomerase/epimerase [Firmicutes bacterium]|nr:sugar phosphate isomerase/epimerase [Bacillota bacterium]